MRSRGRRRGWVVVVAILVAVGAAWFVNVGRHHIPSPPGCTVADPDGSSTSYELTPGQAGNAATIAAVGMQMGMPNHAVTVALATAMQESKLINLAGGDRDSAGLFQQRPSQGWGTYDQVRDPVYASKTFYQHLEAEPDWTQLSVNDAAQLVQNSGAPSAYAKWEGEARAVAMALTGESPAALSCHDLKLTTPRGNLVDTASAELGTTVLSGPHDPAHGWEISAWLVAHANDLGVDRVGFAGHSWTAESGKWSSDPSATDLTFHQVGTA